MVEQIPWATLGHKDWAVPLLTTLCRAVFGLDLPRVAWHFSRTARSANTIPAPMGLGEGRVTSFDSMRTVRFGPQPRAASAG